jgi:transposase
LSRQSLGRLSDEIQRQIRPFASRRDLLMSIPGVRQRSAEVLVAAIGAYVTVFAIRSTWRPGPR